MPRIEIELTSSRPDGTWTWRAAGARQPKGTLDGGLLPDGAKVGDVLRAEADFELDGITVQSVTPPKAKRADGERIEVVGPPVREQLVTGPVGAGEPRGRRGREGGGDGPRNRDGRERRPRDRRPGEGAPAGRGGGRGAPGGGTGGGPGGDRAGRPRTERRERPGGPGAGVSTGRRAEGGPARSRGERAPAATPAPRRRRLQPGRRHRDEVLASLAPEERPVAEQVLRGGIPAVRQAVEEQNARAQAAGEPAVRADALLQLAEDLLPRLRAAEWRDRAEAADAHSDEISLRDLRAVVVGADAAARDDESRALATRVREHLERRRSADQQAWLAEVGSSLDDGRVLRALRLSARPPEPGARFPAEMAERLSEAAGRAMSAAVAPDRWAAVLDAVVASPVRRSVTPEALPEGADDEFLATVRTAAGRVPGVAPLVGMSPSAIPPPPRPLSRRPGSAARRPTPPPPGAPRPTPAAAAPAPPAPAQEPPANSEAPPAAEAASSEAPAAAEAASSEVPAAAEPANSEAPAAAEPANDPSPAGDGPSGDGGDDPMLMEELR